MSKEMNTYHMSEYRLLDSPGLIVQKERQVFENKEGRSGRLVGREELPYSRNVSVYYIYSIPAGYLDRFHGLIAI